MASVCSGDLLLPICSEYEFDKWPIPTYLKGAPRSFGEKKIQAHNDNIHNINEVIIQSQTYLVCVN